MLQFTKQVMKLTSLNVRRELAGKNPAEGRTASDLRLHGFGVKTTALRNSYVMGALHTADSMAWSFGARMNGNGNDWHAAQAFDAKIAAMPIQHRLTD